MMNFDILFMHIFLFKAKKLISSENVILCQIGQSGGNLCITFFSSAISDGTCQDFRAIVGLSFHIHSLMNITMGVVFSQMFHIHHIDSYSLDTTQD